MARPPILLSNGGIYKALAKECAGKNTEEEVIDQMKQNLSDLNERARNNDSNRPIVREIESSNKKEDPRLLWCLANERIQDLKNKLHDWGCRDHNAELSG